ncbi:MAG: lipid droplet-associated protein [Saccharopolyspora sp.]|uniref:lipid droplet-associated protein n=1 Tax=Saccharopolyspora sp. TaxID=33915 RepID=UPI0025E4094D|nr:lipid droplet-associated protein [Saccharopolyspora sp.]MBQ6643287.1 lipid droplet-associated protein [Saccharopolyspora sp.]
MSSFPLPIRVAAGLAAVTVEEAKRLPGQLLGLPVTVVSQALQVSMRVQQQVTELAIKGDETLSALRGTEQQPEWATFDEDEQPGPAGGDAAGGTGAAEPAPGPVTDLGEPSALGDDLAVLPEYDQMSLPQLRGKLRGFSESELVVLLEHEQQHARRPDFERMLSNRLERLRQ